MEIFNHVYVINLDKDTERLAKFDASLKSYGVDYKRVDGIYGKHAMADPVLRKEVSWSCRMLCSYGIIGCYLSHAKLWKQLAQDTSTDYYLVLEDDARFTDDTVPVIKEALSKFDGGFDLMTLFTFSDNMAVACYSDSLMNGKYQVCRNPMLLSTLGYIISKQGALNLLERLGPKASYHVDFMLNLSQLKGIRYLSVSPNVLINDGWLESNVLEGVEITSPADWGLKAIVFSIHQKVNVRNGHFYALVLLILTFTILSWLGWWFKLVMLVTCTVLFLVTPF